MSSYDEHLISLAGGDGDETVEWQFLNDDGFWRDANPNFPAQSAADNARYYGTHRTRSRRVTRAAWRES